MSTTRASYSELVTVRRELVLAVVRRRPGLTASEIQDDIVGDDPRATSRPLWGYQWAYTDLRLLEQAGKVQRITVTSRTILWTPAPEPEPLLWEGDGA